MDRPLFPSMLRKPVLCEQPSCDTKGLRRTKKGRMSSQPSPKSVKDDKTGLHPLLPSLRKNYLVSGCRSCPSRSPR